MATQKNNPETVEATVNVTVETEVKETKKKTSKKASEKPSKAKKETKKATPKSEEKKTVKKTEKRPKKETASKEGKKKPLPKESKIEKTKEEVKFVPRPGSLGEMIYNGANNKYPCRNDKTGIVCLDAKTRKKLTEEEYKEASLHRDICKELVRLSEENNHFPLTYLVYFAIGMDAHKKPIIDKGYKAINIPKAETILRWLKWFAEYNENPKFFTSDKVVHGLVKFYNEYSKKDKDFKALMNKWVKMPEAQGFKPSQWKTMRDFYMTLTKPMILALDDEVATEPSPNEEHDQTALY